MSEGFFGKKDKNKLEDMCPSLSLQQKLIGFCSCLVVGFVLDLMAWLSFPKLVKGDPTIFAVCFSLGILVTLIGSAFLVGLFKQVRVMFKRKRWITTSIVLLALIMTLVSALVLKNAALTLVFMIIELLAYAWYVLSFLPFAQTCVKKLAGGLCQF
jgi:hypothetical protein